LPVDLKERLEDLLTRELALYDRLESKVAEEELSIQAEDWEGLLRALQEKQALISEQETLQESWKSCAVLLEVDGGRESAEFWDTLARKMGHNSYQEISVLVENLREVARRTLERERAVQATLEAHLEALRARMRQFQKGKEAFKTYARTGGASSAP